MTDSNSPDLQSLFNGAEFPRMQLDSGAVLTGGRRRVQRRRVQVLAVAVVALLALVPGGWLVVRGVDRSGPIPAGKTHHLTSGLFGQSDGIGNLGDGKVRLHDASAAGIDFASAPRTYQISRSGARLRVARVSDGHSVDLRRTGSGAAGLFQANDGSRGVVAVEAPADVRWVALIGADGGGVDQPVASYLPDGTAVVLIQTTNPLQHPVTAVIWRRQGGAMGASTGERPAMLTQGRDTFYYFAKFSAFGIDGSTAGNLVDGRALVATGVDDSSSRLLFVVAGLYPRGVRNVRLSPAIPGATTNITAMPGTKWDLVTVRYRATAKAPTPKVITNFGTWDPSQGQPPATAP